MSNDSRQLPFRETLETITAKMDRGAYGEITPEELEFLIRELGRAKNMLIASHACGFAMGLSGFVGPCLICDWIAKSKS